jgi:hypothetical protein
VTRYIAVGLMLITCTSCTTETEESAPDMWSLAMANPDYAEVYLGGYRSLESCQEAGRRWLSRSHEKTYLLECRLNCRKLAPDIASTCEAVEAVH